MMEPPRPQRQVALRLFMAVWLADAWRTHLAVLQRQLEAAAPGYVRWVKPEQLHLTLVFLGDQPETRVAEIEAALREASESFEAFELRLGRLGYFGPQTRPRVLWIGFESGEERLRELHARVLRALIRSGIGLDSKELVAHVTLGRTRGRAPSSVGRALAQAVTKAPPLSGGAYHVESISLVQSQLSSAGPTYREHSRNPLAAQPMPRSSSLRP